MPLLTMYSGALRIGSRGSEAVLWQTFMTIEEPSSSCLVLIHVVPPLSFTVTPFPATPTNNLAVLSPSLGVCHCNKREFAREKFHACFCTNTFYFNWPKFLSVGIVDIAFQSAGTDKSATPTGYLDFHFAPFAVSYELSPR